MKNPFFAACLAVVAFALLCATPSVFAAGKPLEILRVTPSGEDVPAGREIVIQFDRDVVPLGRMEREAKEIPVTITPPLACQWRWLERSALACLLDAKGALVPATEYKVTIRPGIVAEDGGGLAAEQSFSFVTERPRVHYTAFFGWGGASHPVLRLNFSHKVTKNSVEESIVFIEKANPQARHRVVADVYPNENEKPSLVDGHEARRLWIVSPRAALPADTDILLKVLPGLVSEHGPARGVEDAVLSEFATFPEFRVVGVYCGVSEEDPAGNFVTVEDLAKENAAHKCDPQRPAGIAFSTPVQTGDFRDRVSVAPPLPGSSKTDIWEGRIDTLIFSGPHQRGAYYPVLLPVSLDAETAYRFASAPASVGGAIRDFFLGRSTPALTDIFGRPLKGGMDLVLRTKARAPDIFIPYRTAVQEKQVAGDLPLYVQNLDRVRVDFQALTDKGLSAEQSRTIDVPKDVRNLRFAVPMDVRGMLGGASGAVRGTFLPSPEKTRGIGGSFFAQVTPWAVHVKAGHHNTYVWVSDFQSGLPVEGAEVSLFADGYDGFTGPREVRAQGKTDAEGVAALSGLADLGSAPEGQVWQVMVRRGGDVALVPFTWDFNIGAYRVSDYAVGVSSLPRYGHIKAWGVGAQGVYRAGETIQYKIYVRDQSNRAFVPAPKEGYTLRIVDPAGLVVEERKGVSLNAFGALDGEYTVPQTAKVGWYEFQLAADFLTTGPLSAMRVLVSDFNAASFRVESSVDGDAFGPEEKIPVRAAARLYSGGALEGAEIRISGSVGYAPFAPQDEALKGFSFGTAGWYNSAPFFEKIARLDAKGEFAESFEIPVIEDVAYGTLRIESSVRDERGAYISSYASARYVGVDRLVGLRRAAWSAQAGKPYTIEHVVLDAAGVVAAGAQTLVKIERVERKIARVRGPGNAYVAQVSENFVEAGSCSAVSGAAPVPCIFTPGDAGEYRITASVTDTKGRMHKTQDWFSAFGPGYVAWEDNNDNAIKIVPQQKDLKVGDVATFMIQNPFPGARALVTVERLGVMRHYVRTLADGAAKIEIPIEADDVPGFYLSVVVFSPRVAPPPEDRAVDLGKPAFRMGYVAVPVLQPHKKIEISTTPEREIYEPRESVRVTLKAAQQNTDKPEPVELAVAVIDEAVLDLVQGGEEYYDPYKGFYALGALDLENYNLLMKLVGRQHIEKKGANAGGDGGASLSVRSLFKAVAYWNPALATDEKGEAKIEFQAPDNLTGWRVLVMATTPGDRMGLGQGAFKVNRETEVRALTPNQILEGDSFTAAFSVRNRTDAARTLRVEIEAEGDVKDGAASFAQQIALGPFSAATVSMPIESASVKAERSTPKGEIRFTVRAADSIDEDGLAHAIPVLKRRAAEVSAEYGSSSEGKASIRVDVPKDIHPDSGEVSLALSASVIGNLGGAFRYMKDYPYMCWEQKLSKAAMAAQYEALRAWLPADVRWEGARDLVAATLKEAPGYQAASGGMTYFGGDESYVDPYLSAYTALALTWLREEGYEVPSAFEGALQGYLRNLLANDIAPEHYTKAMASSVRAVALAALARGGGATKEDLERYRPALDDMDLFGRAHYLVAARAVEGGESSSEAAREKILSHISQSGGKASVVEAVDDGFVRMLSSSLRSQCAVLEALLPSGPDAAGAEGDLAPDLVRTITQARGRRDHWENTQENLFCMRALARYAAVYEAAEPRMTLRATFGGEKLGEARFAGSRDAAATFSRPLSAADEGRAENLDVVREGSGRFYYAALLRYAPTGEKTRQINAGIDIRREISVRRGDKWVLLRPEDKIVQGDLVRSDLYLSLPAPRNFVVVADPVPGGIEPVNRDLATASAADAAQAESEMSGGSYWFEKGDWLGYGFSRWSFYHSEIRHDSVRFYSDYLDPGDYHLSWIGRAIAAGRFEAMPTRAEEMYDPDIFGAGSSARIEIAR